MTTPIVFFDEVKDDHRHHLRLIRNDCREFMTHNRDEITAAQQDEWWETDARKAMDLRLYWTTGGLPVAYGLVREIDGKSWISGGVMGGWRGKGIGRRIFTAMTDEVLSRRPDVWLDVLETNAPARALYGSLGFVEVSRSGDLDEIIVMVKRK